MYSEHIPYVLAVLGVIAAVVASAHVVMFKRDARTSLIWVGLIISSPLLGPLLYYLFGINRIRRRASRLPIPELGSLDNPLLLQGVSADSPASGQLFVRGLGQLMGKLTESPLCAGNEVDPLINGDQAYPAMLEAIRQARHSIALSTYIFGRDAAGEAFIEALSDAVKRGVAVRVMVDNVGLRYSRPHVLSLLKRANIPTQTFFPTRWPRITQYMNLRNHRKLLIVDGQVGFTGGMNIRASHQLSLAPEHPVLDVHFKLMGPVVRQLQQVFAIDWLFVSGERLSGDAWFPSSSPAGTVFARGVADGPDEDFEKILLTFHGALATATTSIVIVTPYFLPDTGLITALCVASMRGVDVKIVLPERNNILFVEWASASLWWQLLERHCRIWLTPPPFDHTKLLIVDHAWSMIGSSNWDARSLRLNFEFNVECYDRALAARLSDLVDAKIAASREVTMREVEQQPLPIRLRNGVARLAMPFL